MIPFIEKGNYMPDENGIFVTRHGRSVPTKFNDKQQDLLFKTEDTSWWFQYRAQIIISLFRKYCNGKRPVFDIGGGNGYSLSMLGRRVGGVRD